ncbi:hypothetical protein HF325_002677 [Metschnikowia pulcherrima]|uniref:SPIN90/Ldb17 leucine-rich domain-containing protein n=1 Tax=Metschnikowia pulcherrima TaxID=27326 RepID=A0A8H7LFW1_9ASCO|nr:hypothetical protein HF325_002677 [Metschnikowia pulcherrima]
MQGVTRLDSPELPLTSFPMFNNPAVSPEPEYGLQTSSLEELLESLYPILVISDARECNANLSIFIKLAVDFLKTQEETYHTCSILALKLLNLNLFIKNHQQCLGKVLGLMDVFSQSVAGDCQDEALLLKEFSCVTSCDLVPTLIDNLLSNDNFNNYNLAGQDFEDVSKLMAYEEFKLLLLINEQYMMRSISSKVSENKVIEGLLTARKESVNGICGFINLLVYHMNREESHIIRIQMLKFLFLMFSSPVSAKLAYLNDLKILVDIVIRELNDLDYSSDRLSHENCILALTYLKVLHPLLTKTQLNDIFPKYKTFEISEVLSNVIVNCDISSNDAYDEHTQTASNLPSNAKVILKSATKCLSISWLKSPRKQGPYKNVNTGSLQNSSSESLASASSLNSKVNSLKLDNTDSNSSTDSFSMTRIASVRASSISDYNKHTTSHNLALDEDEPVNIFEQNNLNVFRTGKASKPGISQSGPFNTRRSLTIHGPFASGDTCPSSAQTLGLLNLPKEYLSKKSLPPLPKNNTSGQNLKTEKVSLLQEKARYKKAPPPPPPPSRRRR